MRCRRRRRLRRRSTSRGGQVTVSWTVPPGDFTPVTGMSVQVLRGDTLVEIRDNVSSPLSLSGLDLGSAYRFQVRASNQQGSSDWSAPSEPIVPSGQARRAVEPERPIRLSRRATGDSGVLGTAGRSRRRARAELPGAAEQQRDTAPAVGISSRTSSTIRGWRRRRSR